MTEAPHVTDNQDDSRFELSKNGARAELVYRRRADRLVLADNLRRMSARAPDGRG